MSKVLNFLKKRTVFCVATLFAVISMLFVKPSLNYFSYIDFNTLCILFALMATVSGLEKCGIFNKLGNFLCSLVKSVRSLSLVLIFLCFFSSMFITNDVALLTFVPFSMMLLSNRLSINKLIFVIVLQTIAANLGSMLTPIGNPQNLFIFNKTGMSILEFMKILFPYTIFSGFLLLVCGLFVGSDKKNLQENENTEKRERTKKRFVSFYGSLFILCILSVGKLIPKPILAIFVFIVILIFDRKILKKVDWFLLLTFVAFFIFSGNLASIESIRSILENSVKGNELFVSLLASQVISNVPATLMLYNFCDDIKSLLIGVDFGGLGTLVASLASLISFNLFTERKENGFRFLAFFTIFNIFFLGTLLLVWSLL